MKRKKKKTAEEEYLYLRLFLFFVGAAFLVTLFFRVFFLFSESKFGSQPFTVLVEGKKTFILHLDPTKTGIEQRGAVSWVLEKDRINNKTLLAKSIFYKVPIDGVIFLNADRPEDIFSLKRVIGLFLSKNFYQGLGQLDILKMYLFYSENHKNVSFYKYDFPQDLFSDWRIINEKISIEVINGSSIDGAASAVATMLRNAGFNVVFVSTKEEQAKSEIIVRTRKNYTVGRLIEILPFAVYQKQETAIADISIILGRDVDSFFNKD
jgi:hypothetical protein